MSLAASQLIAQDFMRGFFDTVDALLAVGISADVGAPTPATEASINDLLGKYSVYMHGNVDETGVVAVFMTPKDALYFAATVMGEETPEGDIDSVPAEKMGGVQEVFDSCLGGGCGTLKDTCSKELAFTDVAVSAEAQTNAGEILSTFDGDAGQMPFKFSAPNGISGEGVVLVAKALASLLPQETLASLPSDEPEGPAISEDEMGDILGGFSPDVNGTEAPAAKKSSPGNIDMVMDINLVCTARLGRVEMPIGEILEMGPGSIIEVGQVIDEPVELLVNEKLIARGDVVVVDEKFGLRITEIISPAERIKSLQ